MKGLLGLIVCFPRSIFVRSRRTAELDRMFALTVYQVNSPLRTSPFTFSVLFVMLAMAGKSSISFFLNFAKVRVKEDRRERK